MNNKPLEFPENRERIEQFAFDAEDGCVSASGFQSNPALKNLKFYYVSVMNGRGEYCGHHHCGIHLIENINDFVGADDIVYEVDEQEFVSHTTHHHLGYPSGFYYDYSTLALDQIYCNMLYCNRQ